MTSLDAPDSGRVFGAGYAGAYDTLYADKNYAAEVDLLERVFDTYGTGQVRRVLDLGCGTGSHTLLLAERGYEVTGVDRSEAMLAQARAKAEACAAPDRATFVLGRVTDARVGAGAGAEFDAVVLMFAVLGYQVDNADVLATLATVRSHLRPGGLLFFDVWYGPAVLSERPAQRIKVVPVPGGEILRSAAGELDVRRHTCTVHYDLWRIDGDRVAERSRESHVMRFFFPREVELLLELSGFELIRLGRFPDVEAEPDATTWNVAVVARAV